MLLIITPLLSKSLRFKYLYFVVNILIVSVGAEAGLLSFFLESQEQKKKHALITSNVSKNVDDLITAHEHVEESVDNVQQPSSIFFIDNGENNNAEAEGCVKEEEEDDDEDSMEMSGQELFQKAEIFIGDFYKQLKMQRDESRNKLQMVKHADLA